MEKKERVLNRCRNCGHRPGLSTIPPWTVAECGICKQIQSAANYPELVKRWNEANPKGEPDNGAKPEPIWTALEGEPEFNLAPESEPVLPKNSAANHCKCGGDVIYFQTIDEEHWFICSKCGQKLSSKISYMDLVAKWNEANPNKEPRKEISLSQAFSPIKEIRLTARIDDLDLETEPESEPESEPEIEPETEPETEPEDETDLAPESEPVIPPGWSHATDFSSFKDPEERTVDPNIPPVHPIHRCSCGGEPEFYSLLNGPIYFICSKCRKMITGFKPFSEMIADWNKANPLDETERPNLDPGRGPCTCPGFKSPLQYQVGGDHYHRFNYQPIQLFRETNLDFDRANAIKYLARLGHKGDPLEDLQKALQYLDFYKVRQDYETARCEEFISQLPDGPIRQAIRYIFKGAMYLAKMSVQEIVNEYLAKETETDET